MKTLFFISICILSVFVVQSQETYFTNASNGLIVREEPNINSHRIGKLPYGSSVELLETTDIKLQITNNGDTINGVWIKVRFQNFPFIVSELEDYGDSGEGYVFNKFIEKLNKASIETIEIDSLKFYSLYLPPKYSQTIKITSEKEVEELLASRVTWKDVENLGWTIDEIILDNEQTLNINQKTHDYSFIAYYPTEEVFLFEGGHSSEFSISIKTGESLETVGNPEYIVESPNKKLRLNGWFPGQECSSYFFQEKTETNYRYLVNFDDDVCYFNKFCWINNQEFMYCYTDYSREKGENKYFIGRINK